MSFLKQPKSFAEAENFARLTDAVNRSPGSNVPFHSSKSYQQEQRIKELEGQVNLLISLTTQKKPATQPLNSLDGENANFVQNLVPQSKFQPPPACFGSEKRYQSNKLQAARYHRCL